MNSIGHRSDTGTPGGAAAAAAGVMPGVSTPVQTGRRCSKALSIIDESSSGEAQATTVVPLPVDQDAEFEKKFFTLFDAAVNDVFRLMSSDSFRRFAHSPEYEALCLKLERDDQILGVNF
jgi:hypothetical protein